MYLKALSLQGKPEFQLIGGQGDVELGGIMGSGGIEADSPRTAQQRAVPIAHRQFSSLALQPRKALCQGARAAHASHSLRIAQRIKSCRIMAVSEGSGCWDPK